MEIVECVVCMENQSIMILAPCGHSLCEECAQRLILNSQNCPECRQDVVFVVKNYLLIKLIELYSANSTPSTIQNVNKSGSNNICNHVYLRGQNKGNKCGTKISVDTNFCSKHKKLVCNKNISINNHPNHIGTTD